MTSSTVKQQRQTNVNGARSVHVKVVWVPNDRGKDELKKAIADTRVREESYRLVIKAQTLKATKLV
jgi:hypothetical protein